MPRPILKTHSPAADRIDVELRRVSRFQVNEAVRITLLGADPVHLDGRMSNLSGRGMRLVIDQAIPLDAPVRVDWDEYLVLGEVRYCFAEGQKFAVGLELEHSLSDVNGLSRLMKSTWGDAVEQEQIAS